MLQQFVIIYVNVVHHFNFARKPDKKSQSRREFLLQSWNKKATRNFTSLQFFLLRMSIFHSWSVFVSALEHHFISQLSKVTPETPEVVCCPFKPHIFRCPFFRDPVCISKSSFLWEAMGSSGTLHFDLFPIVRLLAQRLLALRLSHLFPHNLKNI